MSQHKVFVYGTLMKDQPNHLLLEGEKFVCEAVTHRHYSMGVTAAFPVALHPRMEAPKGPIRGEVYQVCKRVLAALDQLEGNGRMYHRTVTPILWKNPLRGSLELAQAMMYVGDDHVWKDIDYIRTHVDGSFRWPYQPRA
jgi:gamma-glutamylcyclotransferase (GGCT)/AIG2-like uncharacterized protein YtfP